MNAPFLFPHPGPLAAGVYLMGSPRFSRVRMAVAARVTALAGSSLQPTVLGLEAGGVMTAVTLALIPSRAGESMSLLFPLAAALAANMELRWKVVSGPGDVTKIGLTLLIAEAGTALVAAVPLTVRWVNGSEELELFRYDTATHTFTESSAGISTGRAAIANAATLLVTIQGVEALKMNAGHLRLNEIRANGGTALVESPRLEFFSGSVRLAALGKSGVLAVTDFTEAASITGGSDKFEFYDSGSLSAVLGPDLRLVAKQFHEPIT